MKIGYILLKLSNFINIAILLILVVLVLIFDSHKSISTQLHTLLPQNEQRDILQEFNKFQSTKKILVSVKGFDKEALNTIKTIEQQLLQIENISLESFNINHELEAFKKKYAFFIYDLQDNKIATLDINKELYSLKEKILNADFSYFIDRQDPLNLLKKPSKTDRLSLKNGHLIIKNYGYISIFNLDSSIQSLQQYEHIYDSIHTTITLSEKTQIFSPIFYFVENSRMIKEDVNKIILFSTLILLILYILILRNFKLLINTLMTLISSILLALLLTSFIFKSLSIFVIVFGISISTVAIDYMFHHYVHHHYSGKKAFNKEVFLGMATSLGAFFIISFISFDLIKQLCYFSMISLLFSYLQFSFLYPKIGFSYKNHSYKIAHHFSGIFSPKSIIVVSVLVLIISSSQIKFDLNLKNLDVENQKLNAIEASFNHSLAQEKKIPVLIKASSLDELIHHARTLKKAFPQGDIPLAILVDEKTFAHKKKELEKNHLQTIQTLLKEKASSFGFQENYFDKAYFYYIEKPAFTLEQLNRLDLEVLSYKNDFIAYAYLPENKKELFYTYNFLQNLSIKDLFEKNLISFYNELIVYGILAIAFIIIMVLFSTKRNYLISFCYILFPLSLVSSLSFLISFNILHLFMIFILLSISIDFGIYMASKDINKNSYKAVFYSLLSTFAGFGVLVFSHINALFSIGIIATLGIIAVTLLLILLKRSSHET